MCGVEAPGPSLGGECGRRCEHEAPPAVERVPVLHQHIVTGNVNVSDLLKYIETHFVQMQEKLKSSCYILSSLKPNSSAEMTKAAVYDQAGLPQPDDVASTAVSAHTGLALGGEGGGPGTGPCGQWWVWSLSACPA